MEHWFNQYWMIIARYQRMFPLVITNEFCSFQSRWKYSIHYIQIEDIIKNLNLIYVNSSTCTGIINSAQKKHFKGTLVFHYNLCLLRFEFVFGICVCNL